MRRAPQTYSPDERQRLVKELAEDVVHNYNVQDLDMWISLYEGLKDYELRQRINKLMYRREEFGV